MPTTLKIEAAEGELLRRRVKSITHDYPIAPDLEDIEGAIGRRMSAPGSCAWDQGRGS